MSSEAHQVARTPAPLTRELLAGQLRELGLRGGEVLLVHSSLSALGWVVGGAVTVIEALLEVLGEEGTLVMPSQTPENTDPHQWENPAVPREWWDVIRASLPAFDPSKTPTRGMGVIAEAFRSWPGAVRSNHPTVSFAARGPVAPRIVTGHDLVDSLGDRSPLGRLYEMDARILLLGVGHGNNTSLHLAEARAHYPGKRLLRDGSAVLVDGERQWVEYEHIDWEDDDFEEVGAGFEKSCRFARGKVGLAECRLMRQRELVDFAMSWFERKR